MPCSCQLPVEHYPDGEEWGPILWKILHGIAERVGTIGVPLYEGDERRALIKWIHAVAKMIPCPSCKEHYEVYLKEHPVDEAILKVIPLSELRTYVKTWFWELHNWVNESLKKPIFPYEDLTETYKGTRIRAAMNGLDVPMTKAIRIRGGQLLGYTEFRKYCKILLALYGA
jgi:hypothetical protein